MNSDHHQALIEASPDPLVAVDVAGRVMDGNAAAAEALGVTLQQLIGSCWSASFTAPEQAEALLAQVLAGGSSPDVELALRHRDGHTTPVLCNLSLYRDARGMTLGVLAGTRDLAPVREAEAILARQRLELHVQQTPLAVIGWTLDGHVAAWNPAAERVFGWPRAEAIGQSWTFLVPGEARGQPGHLWQTLFAQSGGSRSTSDNLAKDGRTLHCEWFNTPLVDAEGRTIGVSSLVMDVTEQVQAARELDRYRDRLEELVAERTADLARSEAHYRTLVHSLPLKVFMKDPRSVYLSVNERYAADFGRRPADFVGLDDYALYPRELADQYRADDAEVLAAGQARRLEEAYVVDGEERWVRTTKTPVRNDDGDVVALLGVFEDITDWRRSAALIEEQAARYDTILSTTSDGFLLVSARGELLDVNDAYLQMSGYSRDELLGMSVADLEFGENESDTAEQLASIVLAGFDRFETRHRHKDGSHIDVEVSTTYMPSRQQFLVFVRDIAERRRSEEEAIHQRLRLEAVLDGMDSLAYVADMQTHELLFLNRAGRAIFSGHGDGHRCYELMQVGQTEQCPFCTNPYLVDADGQPAGVYRWEFQNTRTGAWFDCRDQAIWWADGRLVRLAVATDITARKQAETDLRCYAEETAARNRIAEIFLSADDEAMYAEVLAAVLEVLHSPLGVCGYLDEHGDLVVPTMTSNVWDQCAVADKRTVFPRDTWGDSSWPRALREQRTICCNERSLHTPLGHLAIERHVSLPLVHRGQSVGLVQVANKATDYTPADIRLLETLGRTIAPVLDARLRRQREQTTRLRSEQEREALLADLARSNQDLEQFAYAASHDLQEPLRMISSYTQLLEERYHDQLDQDARDYIAFAVDGANRMQRLIEDLLTYSRVTTRGKESERLDPHGALAEAVSNLRVAIAEAGALVTTDELPPIRADRGQVVQLFQNLVGNGIKFHQPDRTPRIHVGAEADPDDPSRVRFAVRDNGIGIAPRHVDRLFAIFSRLHTRRKYPGNGIGLALCKRIVDRHRGRIWLESEPGQGTTFYFTLPAAIRGAAQ